MKSIELVLLLDKLRSLEIVSLNSENLTLLKRKSFRHPRVKGKLREDLHIYPNLTLLQGEVPKLVQQVRQA